MNKVKNFVSDKGNPIANQFKIESNHIDVIFDNKQTFYSDTEYKCDNGKYQYTISSGTVFQSYASLVAVIDYAGRKFIDNRFYKDSKTTNKYLSMFFGMDSKEIAKGIESGDIVLCEIYQ